jgi:hypothetical protein
MAKHLSQLQQVGCVLLLSSVTVNLLELCTEQTKGVEKACTACNFLLTSVLSKPLSVMKLTLREGKLPSLIRQQ